MARLLRFMGALVLGSLLYSNAIAASAHSKVVILQCVQSGPGAVVVGCDRSIGVVSSCPVALSSCAQALASFEAAPDNLQLVNGGGLGGASNGFGAGFWYTLNSNASTSGSDQK